jgi:hypothetical protein
VLHTYATDKDDETVEEKRFGKVGRQQIEDTGQLTRKRMETVDEEFMEAAFTFMEQAQKAVLPPRGCTRSPMCSRSIWTWSSSNARWRNGLRSGLAASKSASARPKSPRPNQSLRRLL